MGERVTTNPNGTTGWRRFAHPFIIIPTVAVLVVGGWFLFFRSSGSSAKASTTTRQLVNVTSGSLQQTVSAQGTIAALASQSLSFASSGVVTSVNVQTGSKVTTGQVLATLDATSLEASVSQARATLAQAEAKLSDDIAAGASTAQVNADRTSVATANDTLTNALNALSGASLVAGFDGVVTSVNISVGQQLGSSGAGGTSLTGSSSGTGNSSANVGAGNSTTANRASSSSSSSTSASGQINLTTSGAFQVSLGIGSSDISKIKVGQSVKLTVTTSSGGTSGRGQTSTTVATSGSTSAATATGVVSTVGSVASATSGVATFPVVVVFKGDATQFFVGASVIADIVISSTGEVLQLPVRAITTNSDGTTTVQLSKNGSLTDMTRTVVTTGTVSNGMVEIVSGVKKGDQVVVDTTITSSTASTTSTIRTAGAGRTQGSGG